jgi:hypothetical protein
LRLRGCADVLARRISTENLEVPRHGSSGFFTTEDLARQSRNQRSMATKNTRSHKKGSFANTCHGFRSGERRQFVFVSFCVFCGQDGFRLGLPQKRAQRSLGDSPGGSICVHLRHLRLKIRNFHAVEILLRPSENGHSCPFLFVPPPGMRPAPPPSASSSAPLRDNRLFLFPPLGYWILSVGY